MRVPIRRKLFYSHFVAVVLVSGSIGTFFYKSAVTSLFQSLKARLQYSAGLLSRTLDATVLDSVDSAEDTSLPAYRDSLDLLREFQRANADIAFIYVMRREGDRVLFVLDSDTSSRQALPGQEYREAPTHLLRGFTEQAADDEVTRDPWGYFLSGYAPLKGGNGRYLVGIDMRADEVQRKFQTIRITGAVSLALSILLAYLFSVWLAARITRPIRVFVARSGEIASGVLGGTVEVKTGDELEELAQAFNTMTERLQASRLETEEAMGRLEEARGQLEVRVADRTASLTETNEKLQKEVEERTRAEEALAKAAMTDFLTGLANRPALLQLLEHEVERVMRSHRPFSLVLADLDHFKKVNDSLGHEAGDRVLVEVARLLREGLRRQDVIARWGGDELLIFLPETASDGAEQLAQRLRVAVAATPLPFDGSMIAVTLSMGVSTLAQGMSITECVRQADVALYRAKSEGRDRVVVA